MGNLASSRVDRSRPSTFAVALILGLSAATMWAGFRTDPSTTDIDQQVFRETARSMKEGSGYYPAMADAIAQKEGTPPSEVRAFRPPTLFLLLRAMPEPAWRWMVGLVYLAVIAGAYSLARPYGEGLGNAAAVLATVWMIGSSSFLFLHAELWGLPAFLAGLAALQRERDWAGALLIATATLFRELFALGLAIGLVARRRRPPWLTAAMLVSGFGILHALMARTHLDPSGGQAALANEPYTLPGALAAIAPGARPVGWVFGILTILLGSIALVRLREHDAAAAVALPFVAILVPAGIVATRAYWSLAWGPALAAFAPMALTGLRCPRAGRAPGPGGTPRPPLARRS